MSDFKTIPAVQLEYEFQEGNITSIPVGHTTRRRVLPAALFACPIDATILVSLNDRPPLRLTTPEVLLLPDGMPHCIQVESGGHPVSLWCHFRVTAFQSLSLFRFFSLPLRFDGERALEIRRLITAQVTMPEELDLHQAIELKLLGFQLVATLLEAGTPQPDSARLSAGVERLQPALKLLRRDLAVHCSTAELAAAVKISPSRFLALFHELIGMSPGAYREQMRYQTACARLTRTSRSLTEIAAELGYCDAFHFSRRFSQLAGISPSRYRNRPI